AGGGGGRRLGGALRWAEAAPVRPSAEMGAVVGDVEPDAHEVSISRAGVGGPCRRWNRRGWRISPLVAASAAAGSQVAARLPPHLPQGSQIATCLPPDLPQGSHIATFSRAKRP